MIGEHVVSISISELLTGRFTVSFNPKYTRDKVRAARVVNRLALGLLLLLKIVFDYRQDTLTTT